MQQGSDSTSHADTPLVSYHHKQQYHVSTFPSTCAEQHYVCKYYQVLLTWSVFPTAVLYSPAEGVRVVIPIFYGRQSSSTYSTSRGHDRQDFVIFFCRSIPEQ